MMTETNLEGKKKFDIRDSYLYQAWLVIVLSAFFGAILVWVQVKLEPGILENRRLETVRQIPTLVAGSVQEKTEAVEIVGADGKTATVYRACDENGNVLGWVFPASGQGFGDVIDLLIGLDPTAQTLTGIYVLNQKETPGLGNFITEANFRDQFQGKGTNLSATNGVPADPAQIKAVTGATISSQAVCTIINAAVEKYRDAALTAARNVGGSEK